MATYGRQTLGNTGRPVEVSADGKPEWKTGGVSIDWSTVAAVSGSDVTLGDGTIVKVGYKGLEYGTVLAKITASGKFGPCATSAGGGTAATDGRQTLVRGECFILNETVLELGALPGLTAGPSDHPGAIEGGRCFKDRVKFGGTGQPTLANLEAAMPRVSWVEN